MKWKSVPGYENYQVSDTGIVKGLDRVVPRGQYGKQTLKGKVLKASVDSVGYRVVSLCKNGVPKRYRVHRLVMLVFKGESLLHVDHINGDKLDNSLSNLRYCTIQENNRFNNVKRKNKKSKYIGVSVRVGHYQSFIKIDGKSICLGSFKTEMEAHNAYQDARILWNV